MTERRKTRRYDLSLPVTIPDGKGVQIGTTQDVSTRGVYLILGSNLKKDSFDLSMALPTEAGAHVRAVAKTVRTDEWTVKDRQVFGIGAVIQRCEIVRTDEKFPSVRHPLRKI